MFKKRSTGIVLFFCFLTLDQAHAEKKHEFVPEIMMNSADSMRSLTFGALQYTYHINQEFWIGVDGFMGPAVVDTGSALRIQNGDLIWGASPIFYWNVPALLGATEDKPEGAKCQVYMSFGAGYLDAGTEHTIYGTIGGGLLWNASSWFGLRFDLKSLFYMLDNAGGSDFNSDLALSIGPSFIF